MTLLGSPLDDHELVIEHVASGLSVFNLSHRDGNTYFTEVGVYLGATPSFRFYLAEGYTREDFAFYVGGRPATVKNGEGYVEIVMYAYMMLDNVSFHVNGTDVVGTYNLYSYYEYAKTLNDANLTAIVEGLMKYAMSAKAYRDSVVNK